jgi:hypothetical protein
MAKVARTSKFLDAEICNSYFVGDKSKRKWEIPLT